VLFEQEYDPTRNLLPCDGEVFYFGKIFDSNRAHGITRELLSTIDWQPDKAVMFGKTIYTKRKVAWHGDSPFQYSYSNSTKVALPWTRLLAELKSITQERTGETFNSCLLNLYHDGSEGMAWHSDGERDLKPNGAIASLSFGAERKFAFKHKTTGQKVELILEDGSLLLMAGVIQNHWLHRLPPTTKVHGPRVNLTFRTIIEK
jgi:alkylated DNA repair dioxygenase AlkB